MPGRSQIASETPTRPTSLEERRDPQAGDRAGLEPRDRGRPDGQVGDAACVAQRVGALQVGDIADRLGDRGQARGRERPVRSRLGHEHPVVGIGAAGLADEVLDVRDEHGDQGWIQRSSRPPRQDGPHGLDATDLIETGGRGREVRDPGGQRDRLAAQALHAGTAIPGLGDLVQRPADGVRKPQPSRGLATHLAAGRSRTGARTRRRART